MSTKSSNVPRLLLIAALALIVLTTGLALLRVGAPPTVDIAPGLPGIGPRTPIAVTLSEPARGLTAVRVELVQGERAELLAERRYEPRPFWAFWGARVESDEIAFEVGRETLPELREGEATLRVTAQRAPTWLRQPEPVVEERLLPVRLTPPQLSVVSTQTNVAQGGSEAVVYEVGPGAVRHGVRVGEHRFPGSPLPGSTRGEQLAFFAVPHDHDDESRIRLTAADELGNELEIAFVDRFIPKPLKTDTIRLSDGFMGRVVPAILGQTPELQDRGELHENYLQINRDLRRTNAATLAGLAARSRPEILWRESFLQLPNTRAMASFADRRTYLYDGREVDRQDHLGFDLASVRRAPVTAANRGVVLLAEYLGIYGNTVVLDHGYGLLSLYAHLSSFEVTEGQAVERGDSLGRTGQTGLAGGDHLHFSMLVHGVQVNPLEWWDKSWIRDHIARKLGPAPALAE